jgi:hypothetical protein
MKSETYHRTLDEAKAELAQLMKERRSIDERISKLAPLVEHLSNLCDELLDPPPDLQMPAGLEATGLSSAIRLVFKSAAPGSLSPTEVRDKLRQGNFDLDKYKNELPPIHNTILRLTANGEIEEVARGGGERAYKWISGLKRVLLDLEPTEFGLPARRISLSDRVKAGEEALKDRGRMRSSEAARITEDPK